MSIPPLDIRDISIIDSFPIYKCDPIVLNVGCGQGRLDFHLMKLGYKVYACDIERHDTWVDNEQGDGFVKFFEADIYDPASFPIGKAPIVICSEVLEHLVDYKKVFKNLIELTQIRLIITIPYMKSFGDLNIPPPKGHCNFWSEKKKSIYKSVKEFYKLGKPYCVSISKIRTKIQDVEKKQYCYLIIIDKRQDLIFDNII